MKEYLETSFGRMIVTKCDNNTIEFKKPLLPATLKIFASIGICILLIYLVVALISSKIFSPDIGGILLTTTLIMSIVGVFIYAKDELKVLWIKFSIAEKIIEFNGSDLSPRWKIEIEKANTETEADLYVIRQGDYSFGFKNNNSEISKKLLTHLPSLP